MYHGQLKNITFIVLASFTDKLSYASDSICLNTTATIERVAPYLGASYPLGGILLRHPKRAA